MLVCRVEPCHGSQLVAWQITHTRKHCQTTYVKPRHGSHAARWSLASRLLISTSTVLHIFAPSLLPPLAFTALCDVTSMLWHASVDGCRVRTYTHTYIQTCVHTRAFSVSCCSVPWFLKYIDTKDATAWSPGRFTYIHTCIHTYTLLSGRRFFSFMTGDGHGNEDGDNPTHMLPMVTYKHTYKPANLLWHLF